MMSWIVFYLLAGYMIGCAVLGETAMCLYFLSLFCTVFAVFNCING